MWDELNFNDYRQSLMVGIHSEVQNRIFEIQWIDLDLVGMMMPWDNNSHNFIGAQLACVNFQLWCFLG